MWKRMLSILLVAVLALSLFAGCGAKTEDDPNSPAASKDEVVEPKPQENEEPKEDAEPYTVTFWIAGTESQDHDMVMEKINEHLATVLPNTTLEVVLVPDAEYGDRLSKAMAMGEKIDLFWAANWSGLKYSDAIDQEVAIPVEQLIKEYGTGIADKIGGEVVLDTHRAHDGVLYFIPSWQGLSTAKEALLFDQAVVDLMPAGWLEEAEKICLDNREPTVEALTAKLDMLEEYLKVAKDNGLLRKGVRMDDFTNIRGLNYEHSVNEWFVTKEGDVYTLDFWYDSDVTETFYAYMADWYQKGYIREDIATVELLDEDCYILGCGSFVDDDYVETFRTLRESQGFTYECTAILLEPDQRLSNGYATGTMMSYTSENPERAMQLLNLIYTDAELYNMLVFGLEGTHYTVNEDKTINLPALDERTYTGPDNWRVGSCVNSFTESGIDEADFYIELMERDKKAIPNTLAGFAFDKTKLSNETANMKALRSEYYQTGLRFGVVQDWESYNAEFMQKLNEAGYETFKQAVIEQLGAYIEQNQLGTLVMAE